MIRDFSYQIFKQLITNLQEYGYDFQSVQGFIADPFPKSVILRHDIDITAVPALKLAKLEHQLGIHGSYYFRTTKYSFRPRIINEIAGLGHEIGYHYEDLTRNNGNMDKAKIDFEKHLDMFRKLYPVQTVCMHGRSGSPYDNRDMWTKLRLADYNLVAEPYLSLDFNQVLYLSDTTQKWDGDNIAVRDKVKSSINLKFKSTKDILDNINKLPNHVMLTIHPELWTRNILGWLFVKLYVYIHSNYKKYYRNPKVRRLMGKRNTKK